MKKPVHPGAILREDVLSELEISIAEAAERLGVSRVTLSRVVHEHARLSPNLALRLEAAGVGTARVWLALQTAGHPGNRSRSPTTWQAATRNQESINGLSLYFSSDSAMQAPSHLYSRQR